MPDFGTADGSRRVAGYGSSADTPPVLIVGAGPAGLFSACELLRYGVRPRIVERRPAPHHEARGTALQPATLEMLGRAGLVEPFLRAGVHIRHIQLLGPGLREINRDEADVRDELPSAAELGTLLNARTGVEVGLNDLRWVSYFKMHKRFVGRLSDGRRFLLGDAAHLSSPMGGEGLNAALMDAADIAWKLALVLRGAARPALLDSYVIERELADRHALEVSDEVHQLVMGLVATYAGGGTPSIPPGDPAQELAGLRRRLMLDVSYAGSPIVGQAGAATNGPSPGERFPARHRLSGTGHHLIMFGEVSRLDRFRARWNDLVSIVDASVAEFDATEAGVPEGGAVLVRPDGFIGFRAVPANDATMAALNAHLASYLIPDYRPYQAV